MVELPIESITSVVIDFTYYADKAGVITSVKELAVVDLSRRCMQSWIKVNNDDNFNPVTFLNSTFFPSSWTLYANGKRKVSFLEQYLGSGRIVNVHNFCLEHPIIFYNIKYCIYHVLSSIKEPCALQSAYKIACCLETQKYAICCCSKKLM